MNKLTCIIRIRGRVGLNRDVNETLNRLRIRKKFACVVMNLNKEQEGMLKKVKDFVAFGEIKNDTFEKLLEKRGQPVDKSKKLEVKKVAEGVSKGKPYEDFNAKPFFRLHPPRGGIDSKIHFPKGVLGNNGEKINELVERML